MELKYEIQETEAIFYWIIITIHSEVSIHRSLNIFIKFNLAFDIR